MEIVTWVLDGALVHQDSQGHNGVIYPGLAQRMSAGTRHPAQREERRLAADRRTPEHREPVHFVQMWVLPDEARLEPGLRAARDRDAELCAAASPSSPPGMDRDRDDAAIRIQQRVRRAARGPARRPASASQLPDGAVRPPVRRRAARSTLEGAGRLGTGDAARITAADGQRVTAVDGPAEVLVWEMHGRLA